jgi:hypothetical protein
MTHEILGYKRKLSFKEKCNELPIIAPELYEEAQARLERLTRWRPVMAA